MKCMSGIDQEFTGEAWPGAGSTVGYLAQEPELDPTKTVKENVMDGVRAVPDLMARFNEISTLMADPLVDADFDAMTEEMGTLQETIAAVVAWPLEHHPQIAMAPLRRQPGNSGDAPLWGGSRRPIPLNQP